MFEENDISGLSHTNADELSYAVNQLKKENGLSDHTAHFIRAEKNYEINAVILLAIACLESGFGTSILAKEKNNFFGIKANDSYKGTDKYGTKFASAEDCIDEAGYMLGMQYLKRDGTAEYRYCDGKRDIYSVGKKWCSQADWADKVINLAGRIAEKIEESRLKKKIDYEKEYFKLVDKIKNLIKELTDAVDGC